MVFQVIARAALAVRTEAVDPDLAKRIVEDGGAVAAEAAARDHVGPVKAVGGEVQVQSPGFSLAANGAEHLEAALGVFFSKIEPDGIGVAAAGLDDVGALVAIQLR